MYTVFSSVITHTRPPHALPVGLYFADSLKRDLNRWEQSPDHACDDKAPDGDAWSSLVGLYTGHVMDMQ